MAKSQRVTIREVAEACGVSAMTVSYVLNGKREKVSSETCERVLQAVRRLNYVPPSVNSSRNTLGTTTIGVISDLPHMYLTQSDGGYVRDILAGVFERSDELQQNVTLFTSSLLRADIHRSIRVFCDGKCDGLIVFSPFRNSPLIRALKERGTAFITVGNLPTDCSIAGVDVDDVALGEAATDYLIAHGHKRIRFVNIYDAVESNNRREEGYRRAMANHNLPVSPHPFIQWEQIQETMDTAWSNAMSELASMPTERRPTALFGFNDLVAGKCVSALLAAGMRVPEDISVLGVDNSQLGVPEGIRLTSVAQPYREIGCCAVDTLTAIITGAADAPTRRLFGFEIVEGSSVATMAC